MPLRDKCCQTDHHHHGCCEPGTGARGAAAVPLREKPAETLAVLETRVTSDSLGQKKFLNFAWKVSFDTLTLSRYNCLMKVISQFLQGGQ